MPDTTSVIPEILELLKKDRYSGQLVDAEYLPQLLLEVEILKVKIKSSIDYYSTMLA